MLSWRDFSGHLEYYKDLQREAERERRIEWLLGERKTRSRLHHRVLTGVGRNMANWGYQLQKRYGLAPRASDAWTRKTRVVMLPRVDTTNPMVVRECYEGLTEPSNRLRSCGTVGAVGAPRNKACGI